MAINSVATADLVTREVRSGSRDGVPTKIVVASRTYPTDQADLWDAITNSDRIPRWFLPITGDLKLGGRYQLEGNAGGVIERCERPDMFAVTWEFGDNMSWLQVNLSPAPGGGTTFQFAHEAPIDDPTFWNQFGPGAVGVGWDLGLMGLGLYLASGTANPNVDENWALTPDGIEFVRQSAAGWADAAIADGEEPQQAREAAERTITFYTVPPETVEPGS